LAISLKYRFGMRTNGAREVTTTVVRFAQHLVSGATQTMDFTRIMQWLAGHNLFVPTASQHVSQHVQMRTCGRCNSEHNTKLSWWRCTIRASAKLSQRTGRKQGQDVSRLIKVHCLIPVCSTA